MLWIEERRERVGSNRKKETCDCCQSAIYYEDDTYEQDPCYELEDGTILCENCLNDYVKERFYKILQ